MEENKLKLTICSRYIPKTKPFKPFGDDAHFFCERAAVIGVADGVGGCATKGIDAGEYARQLMKNAATAAGSHVSVLNPKKVLEEAYLKTTALGSSTACIVSLVGNEFRAANLGDSGFMVIREGKTVFKSQVQQHMFNCPYQLGTRSKDKPENAEEMVVEVRRGDFVVVGTDGLFDNLFEADAEEVVKYCFEENKTLDVMARALALLTQWNSWDKKRLSPFAKAAVEAGVEHSGGKADDITVVVACVK